MPNQGIQRGIGQAGTLDPKYDGGVLGFDSTQEGGTLIQTGGWVPLSDPVTFVSSANAPTYTVLSGHNLSSQIGVGSRFMCTNQGATQYFIVTVVTVTNNQTTLTLYGGTTYTLAAGPITNPAYSYMKAPVGFNPDPSVWTQILNDTTTRTTTNPTNSTWYNPGTLNLAVPIGSWRLSFSGVATAGSTGTKQMAVDVSLTTASSTPWTPIDTDFEGIVNFQTVDAEFQEVSLAYYREKFVVLSSQTVYSAVIRSEVNSIANINFSVTTIKAVCGYI